MTRYVYRDGHFYDPETGRRMHIPKRSEPCAPKVFSDMPEYASPIDGRLISSRSSRREDLKRNGCVEYDPPSNAPNFNKLKNPRFAKKHGYADKLAPELKEGLKIR